MGSNLLEEEEDDKIKKYVRSTMRGDIINIKIKFEDCLEKNCKGTSVPCESCGAEKEDEDKKEYIREDLINYINKLNQDSRKLLTKKVTDGELEKCDKEELKVIEDCKGPMWMLVNTTIFETLENVAGMVSVMDDELKNKRGDYCNNDDTPPPPSTTNCEWEEYENTKTYLVEVDKTIQENLFKAADSPDAKRDTLLGFVQIQSQFDARVKKLFEDEVRCPEELEQIKKTYMVILNKCMVEFMRPSVDFSTMSRFQRISCIKELRNELEDRTAKLLQFELNDSLSAIKDPGSA